MNHLLTRIMRGTHKRTWGLRGASPSERGHNAHDLGESEGMVVVQLCA